MTAITLLTIAAAIAGPAQDGGALEIPTDRDPQSVVGGAPVAAGDWPDAAAVYWGSSVSCTGVLIAPNLVLTAGHCEGNLTQVTLNTHDYEVGGETIEVAEFYPHPDYNATYDVTVLVLAEDATVTPRPIALDCVVEDYLVAGAEVAIVGYGATDEWAGEWGSLLNEAFATVVDPICEDIGADCNEAVSPGGELISGGGGVDSCNGDSGGPLYLLTSRGDYLIGLTSRGVTPSPTPCGAGGIYVRVDAVTDWIEEVSGIELDRPQCEGINRAPSAVAPDIAMDGGLTGVTKVAVTDPNPEDSHTFAIETEPEHGRVSVSPAGAVSYIADFAWHGEDQFSVRVVDDGDPPLGGVVEIGVSGTIRPERIVLSPVGCNVGAAHTTPVWILVLLLIYRRQ